jgi:hypothetical protein
MYREMTLEWLRRAGVRVAHLIMRNNTDYRSSLEVKTQQLKWLPSLYQVPLDSIRIAYDDRPEVVEMYCAHGVNAVVRSIHNTSAYETLTS